MNKASRQSMIRFLIGTGIGAALAAFNSVRWMRNPSPDAPAQARIWLVLCVFSVVSGLLRFHYYRNRRDYFAEEMERRRSLAKDITRIGKGTSSTRADLDAL
jgi:hypothetical protein